MNLNQKPIATFMKMILCVCLFMLSSFSITLKAQGISDIDPGPDPDNIILNANVKFSVTYSGSSIIASFDWCIINQEHIAVYNVERSADLKNFETISTVQVDAEKSKTYSWQENLIDIPQNFYRLSLVTKEGEIQYGHIYTSNSAGEIIYFASAY